MAPLVLALFLIFTAPAATATSTPTLGPHQCETDVIAEAFFALCAPGKPKARCCDLVTTIRNLPCLCRIAAEREIALSGLSAPSMFTMCGGEHPAAADSAAVCGGVLTETSRLGSTTNQRAPKEGCDSRKLSVNLVNLCETELESPSSTCCESMFTILGRGSSCLCNVTWEATYKLSPLQRNGALAGLHGTCGGDLQMASALHLDDVCAKATAQEEEEEKVCPTVSPTTSKLMWGGWALSFILIVVVAVLLILLHRRATQARVFQAERLEDQGIGIDEILNEEEGGLLGAGGIRALPPLGAGGIRALPPPGGEGLMLGTMYPRRTADATLAPARLV